MDELIRSALLGNAEAQRECTEKGIVLPCPKCYGESEVYHLATDVKLCIGFSYVYCKKCGLQTKSTWPPMPYEVSDKNAILLWNTRSAPPIGRCGECEFHDTFDCPTSKTGYTEKTMKYCSWFEPKGGNHDAES